jgi:hypothetical protein
MEIDVDALQVLEEQSPESELFPCGWTCDWSCTWTD